MKSKLAFKVLDKTLLILIILIFFIYYFNQLSYGLPFFYNQDEIAFQGSTLSSIQYLTGYFELNYNPYYAPLLNLILIIKSIFINEFIINSLNIDQIKLKLYFNTELFLFYGRLASLLLTTTSIYFLYLIFKKLKINFIFYSFLLISFATSIEAFNVSTQFGKNSSNLLIYLIQIYILIKYSLKVENLKFKSYILLSLLASFAWGVNYWPALVSLIGVCFLHYKKFKFSKKSYLLYFLICFIIFGPTLNSFFVNYPPLDHLLPDKDIEKLEINFYLISFFDDFIKSCKIIFTTEKNIILLLIILPFFFLKKNTNFKKEFLLLIIFMLLPILLFSLGDDIPAQLRYFAGIICIILILTAIAFNELHKLNFKFIYILFILSNIYFISENIKMNKEITRVINKKHTFYNFSENINNNQSKILYLIDLNVQESLEQNLFYIKLYENDLIKKNESTKKFIDNIMQKNKKKYKLDNVTINYKDIKKDLIYFSYTNLPLISYKKFFDFIKNDFDYVVIEESQPFYLSNKFLQKQIKSYVKENFVLDKIHFKKEKIFLKDQQAIIHYFTNSLTRFDNVDNINNNSLEVIFGPNYSMYKIN